MILTIIITVLTIHYVFFVSSILRGLIKTEYKSANKDYSPHVSVITVFRNESEVIEKNINSFNNIDYPSDKFEIIYVDDDSSDNTAALISGNLLVKNYKVIKCGESHESGSFKKRLIEKAISKSKGEIILLTDADCYVPENWIKNMIFEFDKHTAIVSGPVAFEESDSIFSRLQKLEFAGLSLAGAGLIGINKPKICSSANLAFRKDVFYSIGGYKGNIFLSSGDDDLLLQKIANETEYKAKYCFNKEALVITRSNKSLTEFSNQRRRWASKGFFYKDKVFIFRLLLIFLYFLNLLILPIFGLFYSLALLLFFISFVLKCTIDYLVIRRGEGLFFSRNLLRVFLLAEFLHLPYIVYASIMGTIGGYTWKGRKVGR